MNEVKKNKLAALIHTLSAEYFLKEDLISYKIIVTSTSTSKDSKTVNILVRVDQKYVKFFLKNIKSLQKNLRFYIASRAQLRYCPNINLQLDNSLEAAQKIENLLKK